MRIPSGKLDQSIAFVAVDAVDLKTRETGLSSFTVVYSRNGGAATTYTTPTVTELSAGSMPGVYALLLDESSSVTIAAGSDSEELVLHITQASMAPVTRSIELYRRDTTSGQTITVANGAADADIERIQGTVVATPATAGILDVNVKNIDNDAASASGTVTFPNATLASTTNITAGTITTTTNLTNLPSIPSNWITAAGINAAALNGKGDWNIGKTGYSLTQAFPTNFSALAITAGGLADITQAAADKVWGTAARVLTAGTNIALAKGTGVTGFTDLSASQVENAVWDAVLASHLTGGSTGAALNGAGSAGDPWNTALPGAYSAGTAGKIVGDNLNAAITSRMAAGATADANVVSILSQALAGAGTGADPWRPV